MAKETKGESYINSDISGLNKREYFAAMAMQGLLALGSFKESDHIAKVAVKAADNLILELNKQQK